MEHRPILIVNGSPSRASRTAALVEHVAAELRHSGLAVETLALRDLPAEPLLRGEADAAGIREAVAACVDAPGLVLATPIYKAAYSGLLKVYLDLLPQFALTNKTVLPLATGGSLAHVLAIDYALRPVLSSLGARHVVAGFFVLDKQLEVAAPSAGSARLEAAAKEKLTPVLTAFIDSLTRHAR